MKIALINGSPKRNHSTSRFLLQELKKRLEKENPIIVDHHFKTPYLSQEEIEKFTDYDVLVFSFPLYFDGIPSHLISCLMTLEALFTKRGNKNCLVYGMVNCGFYEGLQNRIALEILQNWCVKSNLIWGQGLGIGAGQMLSSLKNVPSGEGPKKNLDLALRQISTTILRRSSTKNLFINPNLPRLTYKLAGEMQWRKSIKTHGLKRKDLDTQK